MTCIVADLPGITDVTRPRRLGPKRASKIRRLFVCPCEQCAWCVVCLRVEQDLDRTDDVRKYVVRRQLPPKEGKCTQSKAPKIQRLVTPVVLQRRRKRKAIKVQRIAKANQEKAEYAELIASRLAAANAARAAAVAKKKGGKKGRN